MTEFSGKKMLLVEDDSGLSNVYKQQLERLGFLVYPASNENDAADLVSNHTFHLAWVDLSLRSSGEDRHGYDVVRGLVAQDEGTSIVVVTDYDDYEEALKSVQNEGAHDFISKKKTAPADFISHCVPVLSKLLARCSVDDFVELSDAKNVLIGKSEEAIVTSMLISSGLTRKYDANQIWQPIHAAYNRIQPVRTVKSGSEFLLADTKDFTQTDVWSKRLGFAVSIFVGLIPDGVDLVYSRDKGLPVSITKNNRKRNDFI